MKKNTAATPFAGSQLDQTRHVCFSKHWPIFHAGSRNFFDPANAWVDKKGALYLGQNIYVNTSGRPKRIVVWNNVSTVTSPASQKCDIFSTPNPQSDSAAPLASFGYASAH